MADLNLPPADKELRYRNVSIHSQGKTEHGTLYLLKHHACFSYYPGSKKDHHNSAHSRTASGTHNPSTHGSNASSQGSTNNFRDVNALPAQSQSTSGDGAQAGTQPKQQKVRPKDIWIPYPMIGYCILRPSHAASIVARPMINDRPDAPSENGDELFPPTFGTSGVERPSTDSARLAPYSTPPRPSSPVQGKEPSAYESLRQPVIRIRRKDFQMMALHFNSGDSGMSTDETARQAFHVLRKRCCIEKIESLHAFHYQPHKDESRANVEYDARKEYARMGISPKAADGPGAAWRLSEINQTYTYSRTYPNVLCVPKAVSDNMLKYGASFRSRSRIPCLTYLHSNGGSITRSSQPQVGWNKRSPQDERLVSAIFSSHTPATESLDSPAPQASTLNSASSTTLDAPIDGAVDGNYNGPTLHSSRSEPALDEKSNAQPPGPRIYGSTRRNLIVDARPRVNMEVNRIGGGGMENVAHYTGSDRRPVEKEMLNIANIHAMRKSLDKVFDSFGSADYVDMKPSQEGLRKSGWLGHIAGLLAGAETIARVVGLGGSHALIHCSDGWDRTSQVAALAQIMLDPYYRTLNGFITLVQKDFMSFGHKFRDRDGIEGYDSWFQIENERIAPSRTREGNHSDPTSFNAMGQRAFKGAQQWFQRNRGNLFNQPRTGADSPTDSPSSRSSSPPPPNPLIHSTPTPSSTTDDSEHKMSASEISPVFHQFLDTVYQLLHQQPSAFEFNERFLKRLFYHTYACQYGEFLFNNEKDRAAHPQLPSVWGHFLARRAEFTNPDFKSKEDDPLLFPKRRGGEREVEVRWWAGLFGRKDEEMNLPRALAPADPAPHTAPGPAPLRPSMSMEEKGGVLEQGGKEGGGSSISETKSSSTPSFAAVRDSLTNSFSSMGFSNAPRTEETASSPPQQDPSQQAIPSSRQPPAAAPATTFDQMDVVDDTGGDPLGAQAQQTNSSGGKREAGGGGGGGGGLDFAAFASQNAYRDR